MSEPIFLRKKLNLIQDELDSRQICVRFEIDGNNVSIEAEEYSDRLLAKTELRRAGIPFVE
jgi:hypothetical protein